MAACGAAPSGERPSEPEPADAGAVECTTQLTPDSTWLRFELDETLKTPGGAQVIERPEVLLNAWLVHLSNGCFAARWRFCTHGACELEPRGDELECPCHGSRFATDGRVLTGPATRGLKTFPAVRQGDAVYVKR